MASGLTYRDFGLLSSIFVMIMIMILLCDLCSVSIGI